MGALPIPDFYPHALYIEELHNFFQAQGLHYGSPADLVRLVERLDDPGLFHEDMRAMVRAILTREQNSISRSDLLAMLAVAVGGPLIYRSATHLRQPLSQLLAFVDGILRRSPVQPTLGPATQSQLLPRADVIPFPAAPAIAPNLPAAASGRSRVWLTAIPRSALRSLRPAVPASPSFRSVWWIAAGVTLVMILLALMLRPRHSVAAAMITPDGYYAPKPSAYGLAFQPSFSSFLGDAASMPVTFSPGPVDSPDSDLLTPAALAGSPGSVEPAELAPQPQPAETQPATAPSPASLRLAPEFSQPASEGVVPAASPATQVPGVVPAAAAPPTGVVPETPPTAPEPAASVPPPSL
jgi:hypothetical protein